MSAPAGPADPVFETKATSWTTLLALCRVPYGVVALVGAGLLAPPQLQDMLAAIETGPQVATLAITMGLFAFLSWFWARTAVAAYFKLDTKIPWPEACDRAGLPRSAQTPLQWVAYGPLFVCGLVYGILALRSDLIRVWMASVWGVAPVAVFVGLRRQYSPGVYLVFPAFALTAIAVHYGMPIVSPYRALTDSGPTDGPILLQIIVPLTVFLCLPFVLSRQQGRSIALWVVGLLVLVAAASYASIGFVIAAVSIGLAVIPALWAIAAALIRWVMRNPTMLSTGVTEIARRLEKVPFSGNSPMTLRALVRRGTWVALRTLALALLLVPGLSLIAQEIWHGDPAEHSRAILFAALIALPLLVPVVIRLKGAARDLVHVWLEDGGWARVEKWRPVGDRERIGKDLMGAVSALTSIAFWLAATITAIFLIASTKGQPWELAVLAAVIAAIPIFTAETRDRSMTLARFAGSAPIGGAYAWILLVFGVAVVATSGIVALSATSVRFDLVKTFYPYLLNVSPVLLGAALTIGPLTALSFLAEGYRWGLNVPWVGQVTSAPIPPPILVLLTYWTLAAPYWFELHPVRVLPGDVAARPTLTQHWSAWQARCGERRPIIVAISGGASRAGLAGAAALDRVDAIARATGGGAIYAISSVSGGSLGAAAYLARFADASTDCTLSADARFEEFAKALGEADAIGPLLAGSMFADIPRALFGFSALFSPPSDGDRAAALEQAFEANAAKAGEELPLGRLKQKGGLPFDASLLDPALAGAPLWIANGTERDTGARMITTQVRPERGGWPFAGASDALGQLCSPVRISTAINNTARFPFLEPGGVVRRGTCAKAADLKATPVSIIDGGYFDNSGLESATELAAWIREHGGDPIIVAVSGDGDSTLPAHQIVRCGPPAFDPASGRPQKHVWEPLGPVFGLYNVRAGHVDLLLRRTKASACVRAGSPFFHLYLPALGRQAVPLNWVLSKCTGERIWSAMAGDPTDGYWCASTALEAEERQSYEAYLDGNKDEIRRLRRLLTPMAARCSDRR